MSRQKISEIEQKYNISVPTLHDLLISLEEKYLKSIDITRNKDEAICLPKDVVIPDEKYVKSLISNLSGIRKSLGTFDFEHFKYGINDILKEGDFEDADEIMGNVHELIKKYVYGSDTKVSAEEWTRLEKYIEKAGYIAVSVKAGDNVAPFKKYFERPIPASGGVPGTIKQIQLKPFTIRFFDGEQIRDELKLCGKCTYYK